MDLLDVIVGGLAAVGLFTLGALAVEGVNWLRARRAATLADFTSDDATDDPVALARATAESLEEETPWFMMTPPVLEADPRFEDAVAALSGDTVDVDEVVGLSTQADGWVASMALAALARRDDVPAGWSDRALRTLPRPSYCEDAMQLRAIAQHAEGRTIGQALARYQGLHSDSLVEFVRTRIERGEPVDADTFRGHVAGADADELAQFVERHGPELGETVLSAFADWQALRLFDELGRTWARPYDVPPALLAGRRAEVVELVLAALSDEPRRSVLLVGAHGTGKSALARAALERLPTTTVFEASATEIMAGASFIGELEARVRRLAEAMRTRDVVWALPDLQATLYAGQHSRSPQGLLDAILPNVESGAMTLVAEITPTALEALQTARPRLTSAFDVVRLRALENDEALAVARHELEHDELEVTADDATLARAYDLAQQFLSGVSAPGNLVRLVRATVTDAAERGVSRFDAGDVLSTLASASGLPLRLLDADAPLHLEDVRSFFEERILEQPDAIDCVVDRIAMIKAGLTDPTRPLGVFLLLGPTGTGKTEIAKALAEFLFGSAERLVRLDMSEFKTPEALERLLAPTTEVAGTAGLVASVRSNPFSVVLLDEFEKAAEPVWDVFLQVFDDGRLTDAHGNLVDFRRTVIVLTSNVGSAIAARPGAGFAPTEPGFSPANAERALQATFRPEFLNRLDRVVFFRAFERSAMRSLLDKELASALARRGLRERPWAIEVDESAYAFLVENGFSPTLGARPLRRAIERHLLAPLAAAIVEQRVPAGDQFLFVSAPAGAIEVTFVDPDADAVDTGDEPSETVDLLSLARNGRADARSARHVLAEAARIEGEVDALGSVKAGALAALAEPSFWETPGRFATLAKAEYLDRLEAATQTSRRLATRVERSLTTDGSTGGSLVQLLAGRLVVLDAAVRGLEVDDPYELFLEIIPSVEARADGFHERLEEMYRGWGRRRGMTVEALHTTPGSRLFHVSGLGCWRLLHEEAGLHVLEQPKERGSDRETVRVSIAPRRPGPFEDGPVVEARRALERVAPPTVVVRRYRDGAASLVRDAVRGYRTGHLDRVLEGEFDLF